MKWAEDRYRTTPPERVGALHATLPFHRLLTDHERGLLSRRHRDELVGDPRTLPPLDPTRVKWDMRCRQMVVHMLDFGAQVSAAKMAYVRHVDQNQDAAVLALTASGSMLALDRPARSGLRHLIYWSDQRDDSRVALGAALDVGKPALLGPRKTSDLLLIAHGDVLPHWDDAPPAGPEEAAEEEEPDEPEAAPAQPMSRETMQARLDTLRMAVENSEKAQGQVRRLLQAKAVILARSIQRELSPRGGFELNQLAWFETGSGSRYEVSQQERIDLARRNPRDPGCIWMNNADIGTQSVIEGAPLIVFYDGVRGLRQIAFIFRVAAARPL